MSDRPVIQITEPEVIKKENETFFDYDKSHVIYKTQDLGSFTELQKMKLENKKYKEVFDKLNKYINDNSWYYNDEDSGAMFCIEEEKEETFCNDILDILKEVE